MNNNSKLDINRFFYADAWHATQNRTFRSDLYTSKTLKICQFHETSFLSFSQSLNKFLDAGASLSRPNRFDLCPTNRSVTVSLGQRHRWAMQVSTVLTLDRMDFEVIFQQIYLNTALIFTSEPRGEVPAILSKFRQNPSEVSAILFRALFSQNRDFFC